MIPQPGRLGRIIPPDFSHTEKYPLATVTGPAPIPARVEKHLILPKWHRNHDQGSTGSCTGHASVMAQAILNTAQNKLIRAIKRPTRRYNPLDVWREAKRIDDNPNTDPNNDNDGAYVHSAFDVLRTEGPRRVTTMHVNQAGVPVPIGERPRDPREGLSSNYWATSVDEVRLAISKGLPLAIGIDWYAEFDTPELIHNDYWIGTKGMSTNRGGHALCLMGASDRREAFRIKNSWGAWPMVWMPYATFAQLLLDGAEACVPVDR